MYSNYPDWGPASHSPENPRSIENTALAVADRIDRRVDGRFDLQDGDVQDCDDN